jgi:thioredoxin 1
VDQYPDPAISLGVTSVPTLIVFKNGDEYRRFIGIQSEETLTKTLEDALKKKQKIRASKPTDQ